MLEPTDPIILFCRAIATEEGWFSSDPTVLPRKLNNPGDLHFAGQTNASPVPGLPFAQFPSPAAGELALIRDMCAKIATGMTPRQIISVWAPPNENNTAAYIQKVQFWTNLKMDVPMIEQLAPLVSLAVLLAT